MLFPGFSCFTYSLPRLLFAVFSDFFNLSPECNKDGRQHHPIFRTHGHFSIFISIYLTEIIRSLRSDKIMVGTWLIFVPLGLNPLPVGDL